MLKLRYTLILLSLILVLVAFSYCQQKTSVFKIYYISSSEGDDKNDGLSPLTPWKSFENIKEIILLPGESILLKRGDEFTNLELNKVGNGTVENMITLGSYGNESDPLPVLNAGKMHVKSLYILNLSNWKIQDLHLKGSTSHQMVVNPKQAHCENIKILRCHIDGSAGQHGLRFETNPESQALFGARNIEIAYCLIENAGHGVDNVSDGINAPNIQKGAYIHHNRLINNVSEAIDIGAGKNHIVEYNFIDGKGYFDSGGIKTHVQTGNKVNDTENVIIRYNIIKDCIQHGIQIQDPRNIHVLNNTVYSDIPEAKVVFLMGTANEDQYNINEWVTGNLVQNNIFFGNTYNPKQAVLRFTGNKYGGPSVIWNDVNKINFSHNLIYGGDYPGKLLVRILHDPIIDFYSSNTSDSLKVDKFFEIHKVNYTSNPFLNDPKSDDFSLKPDSPGIDNGTPHEVKRDFLNIKIKNRPNIGAIEKITT